jgi:hypothetical protein
MTLPMEKKDDNGISMGFMFTIHVRFVSIFILVNLHTSCSCSEHLPTLCHLCVTFHTPLTLHATSCS